MKRILAATAFIAALCTLCAPVRADMTFTGPQLAQLLKAVADADKSPGITIDVLEKSASEMPAYDPLVHYAGIDPKNKHAVIWMVSTIKSAPQDAASNAFHSAVELAVMDTGFAGPMWKGVYDRLAADDASLPASVTNRYENRLGFTAKVQQTIDNLEKSAPAPAPTS